MLTFLLACPFSLQQEHICVQGAFVHILLDPLQGKETQGCSGEQFQWPHHRGDPAENANSGTGQGEATLEHQAAPKQGIQSRDAPVMCQDSCLSSRKGSPGCSTDFWGFVAVWRLQDAGILAPRAKTNCHRGLKPTGLQTKEGWAALRKQKSQGPAFYSAPDRTGCSQGADLTPKKEIPTPQSGT